MERFEKGCETPEEAACGDIPRQFATVVGSRVDGDTAIVWLLTNDQSRFELYEVSCEGRSGRWYFDAGTGGFAVGAPGEVLAEARRLVLMHPGREYRYAGAIAGAVGPYAGLSL